MDRLTPEAASQRLVEQKDARFVQLFRHGLLVIEVYKPDKVDLQQPHTRDEVYVVISGSGSFMCGDKGRRPFGPGEVLFVPAGVPHRFEDFSSSFATWVLYYGPKGGEAAA